MFNAQSKSQASIDTMILGLVPYALSRKVEKFETACQLYNSLPPDQASRTSEESTLAQTEKDQLYNRIKKYYKLFFLIEEELENWKFNNKDNPLMGKLQFQAQSTTYYDDESDQEDI